MSPAKPTVRLLAPLTWSVSLRTHRATVSRVEGQQHCYPVFADTIVVHGTDGRDYTITLATRTRTEAELLAYVVSYFDAVDDAQVYCDMLLTEGIDHLTKKQASALTETMLQLARGYGPVALEKSSEGVFVTVVPGVFVRYAGTERGYGNPRGPRSYTAGSRCIVSSYNLKYMGDVTKITSKFVWCRQDYRTKQTRHTFDSFRLYNRMSTAEAAEHNAEERMYI